MIQNPMLDYELIDVFKDLNYYKINTNLMKYNKQVSKSYIQEQIDAGKKEAKLVKVTFKRFLKKLNKMGVEGIKSKFNQAGLDFDDNKIISMKNEFEKLGKNYEYYLFFN